MVTPSMHTHGCWPLTVGMAVPRWHRAVLGATASAGGTTSTAKRCTAFLGSSYCEGDRSSALLSLPTLLAELLTGDTPWTLGRFAPRTTQALFHDQQPIDRPAISAQFATR